MVHAAKDIVFALRTLARNPAFTAVVVTTLGLGIGANTAVFSLVDGVLLKPLPFRDPDRLMMVWHKRASVTRMSVSDLDLADYCARIHVFQELAGVVPPGTRTAVLTGAGEPVEIAPAYITQNYFSLLGVTPLIGRDFLPEEGRHGHSGVAVLSYSLWQSRFGGSPDVLQQQITLNHQKLQVVGVMGPQVFPAEADVFVPFAWLDPGSNGRNTRQLNVVGRLRRGQRIAAAQSELDGIAADLARAYPKSNGGVGVSVVPLLEDVTGSVREPILLLQLAVALVLLIACGNVASLLLVRAAAREKEIAIRVALGAGRGRIVAQFATECLLLSSAGAAMGLLLALGVMPLIRRLGAERIPRLQHVAIDARVLLFTIVIAGSAGLLFGLIPTLKCSSANLNQALRAGGRTSQSDSLRMRNVLVGGEVAIALVVMVGASLLMRSLNQLVRVDPGFRADHVLVGHIRLPLDHFERTDVEHLYKRLLPRIAAIPGVIGVSTANCLPVAGPLNRIRFALKGTPLLELEKYPVTEMVSVDPEFFRTMGIPILNGRTFKREEVDDFDHEKCIINRTFANTYFDGQDPIGRVIINGIALAAPEPCEVVGVVGDTSLVGLDTLPQPTLYYAAYVSVDNLVVRTAMDPLTLARAVQREVAATDPEQPLGDIRSMDEVVSRSLSRRSFWVLLLAIFSSVGLVLAALGLYGVVSYSVTRRTQEVGVRMALGAQPSNIFRLILWQGLLVTGSGLLVGGAAAAVATRLMSNLLFGIAATDLLSFAVAGLSLLAVSTLASVIPAFRASHIDPMVALRYE